MQLRSLRRTFSGTQLKFWIGLILHMLHYKMACIHPLFWLMTTPLHPQITHKACIIIFLVILEDMRGKKAQKRSSFSPPQLFSPLTSTGLWNIYLNQVICPQPLHDSQSNPSDPVADLSVYGDEITSNNYAGHFSISYLIESRTLMPRKLRRKVDVFASVVFSPCPQSSSLFFLPVPKLILLFPRLWAGSGSCRLFRSANATQRNATRGAAWMAGSKRNTIHSHSWGGGRKKWDQIRRSSERSTLVLSHLGMKSGTSASMRGSILGEGRSKRDGARWAERFASGSGGSLRRFRMFRRESH